jgi:hypothetical protein
MTTWKTSKVMCKFVPNDTHKNTLGELTEVLYASLLATDRSKIPDAATFSTNEEA